MIAKGSIYNIWYQTLCTVQEFVIFSFQFPFFYKISPLKNSIILLLCKNVHLKWSHEEFSYVNWLLKFISFWSRGDTKTRLEPDMTDLLSISKLLSLTIIQGFVKRYLFIFWVNWHRNYESSKFNEEKKSLTTCIKTCLEPCMTNLLPFSQMLSISFRAF